MTDQSFKDDELFDNVYNWENDKYLDLKLPSKEEFSKLQEKVQKLILDSRLTTIQEKYN